MIITNKKVRTHKEQRTTATTTSTSHIPVGASQVGIPYRIGCLEDASLIAKCVTSNRGKSRYAHAVFIEPLVRYIRSATEDCTVAISVKRYQRS